MADIRERDTRVFRKADLPCRTCNSPPAVGGSRVVLALGRGRPIHPSDRDLPLPLMATVRGAPPSAFTASTGCSSTAFEATPDCRWYLSKKNRRTHRIHLVLDNLNIHSLVYVEKILGKLAGRRLWRRFQVHYTPKHASWLNAAELEASLVSRECLGRRRISMLVDLISLVSSWRRAAEAAKRVIIAGHDPCGMCHRCRASPSAPPSPETEVRGVARRCRWPLRPSTPPP